MIDLSKKELREILKDVQSEKAEVRFFSLQRLYNIQEDYDYQETEEIDVHLDVMKDFIKVAASQFPTPVDVWDNPSYGLIDYVCYFDLKELVEPLIIHFDAFSLKAKERVIVHLLSLGDASVFSVLEEKILALMNDKDFEIPANHISEFPEITRRIISRAAPQLHIDHFRYSFYNLVVACNRSGHGEGLEKDLILPILMRDYETEKQAYLAYDANYSTKLVYTEWQEKYMRIRRQLLLFISLMEFYCTPEIEREVTEALDFNDPLVKTEALSVSISRKLPYEKRDILECAKHIESAEVLYWKLQSKNALHLYPKTIDLEPQLGKTRMFYAVLKHVTGEVDYTAFHENIEVIQEISVLNAIEQEGFYYLCKFDNHGETYVGWSGVFERTDGKEIVADIDFSFTEFIHYDSMTIEEHEECFGDHLYDRQDDFTELPFVSSAPKVGAFYWVILFIGMALSVKYLEESLFDLFMIPFYIIIGSLLVHEYINTKKDSVLITGTRVIKRKNRLETSISIADITKVRRNWNYILIYDKQNQLAMKIPKSWIEYNRFDYLLRRLTAHLKHRPSIQS